MFIIPVYFKLIYMSSEKELDLQPKRRNGSYHCDRCAFTTPFSTSFKRHLKSNKHLDRVCGRWRYNCVPCNFHTDDRTKYVRHTRTRKHISREGETAVDVSAERHKCLYCDNTYKYKSSASRHMKKCPHKDAAGAGGASEEGAGGDGGAPDGAGGDIGGTDLAESGALPPPALSAEQLDYIVKSLKEHLDIAPRVVNNTFNNNVYIENFLNTHCAEAPNITDFVRQIHLQVVDLIHMSQNGFASSASKVLMDHIGGLDITKRPIHCTNKRNRVMYIKDNDSWDKDSDHTKMCGVVKQLYRKHVNGVIQYEDDAPPDFFKDAERAREKNNMIIALGKYAESESAATKAVVRDIADVVYATPNTLADA
jgi:hypothetical protein